MDIQNISFSFGCTTGMHKILIPLPRIEPMPTAVETQSPNPWTTLDHRVSPSNPFRTLWFRDMEGANELLHIQSTTSGASAEGPEQLMQEPGWFFPSHVSTRRVRDGTSWDWRPTSMVAQGSQGQCPRQAGEAAWALRPASEVTAPHLCHIPLTEANRNPPDARRGQTEHGPYLLSRET